MNRVGAYHWRPGSDRWAWNHTMYRLLGYRPGEVIPSRALVVAHKHPDDRGVVEDTMARSVLNLGAYTCRHRVREEDGDVHHVLAVGYTSLTDGDPHSVLRGYLIDVGGPARSRAERDGLDGHDRIVHRAATTLADALEMPLGAGTELVGHLANTHEVPLVVAAERVISTDLDPDLSGLTGLLKGIDTAD